jgi:hypothetical protein
VNKTTIVVISAHARFTSAMPILLLFLVFAYYGPSAFLDQKRDFFLGFPEKKNRKGKFFFSFFSFAIPEHHRSRKTHISAEIAWFPGGFLIYFPGPGGPSNFLISWHQEFTTWSTFAPISDLK